MCQRVINPDDTVSYYSLGGQQDVDFVVSSNRGLMLQYTAMGGTYIAMRSYTDQRE